LKESIKKHNNCQTLQSKLGGNCRFRVSDKLQAKGKIILKPASGDNPNTFYNTASVKKPLVSSKAKLNGVVVNTGSLYDFATIAGGVYEFIK
jgi:alpha-L-fucosidase 2